MANRPARLTGSQRAGVLNAGERPGEPEGPTRVTADGRHGGRPDHLHGLDGLRGIAVVAVVAYHLGRLPGGFVGVDVFFVLSGFLITRLLIAERAADGRISLRGFWARRVRRLLPPMALVAVLVMATARQLLTSWRLNDLRLDALSALGFVANWRFIGSGQSYFEATDLPSPLRHTWSLAVEEQFYVLWPLLFLVAVALGRRHRRSAVAIMAAAVAVLSAAGLALRAGAGADVDLSRLYYGTDTRIFAMAIGGLVASFFDPLRARMRRDRRAGGVPWVYPATGAIGVVGILTGFAIADDQAAWMYRAGFLGIAIATATVIVGLVPGTGVLDMVLSWRPLCWIGARSYGIYLFSWPIQIFAEHRFPLADTAIRDVGVVAVTILFAWASFRLLERPVIEGRLPWHRGGRPVRRRGRVPGVVAGSVAAAALVVAIGLGADPKPDFLEVDEAAEIEAAMRPGGFESEGVEPDVADRVTTSTTEPEDDPADRFSVRSIDAAPPDALDPGPDPPFDPRSTVVVDASERDPVSVFGRPLRILLLGDSVPASVSHRDWDSSHLGVDLQRRAMYACSLAPGDWTFHIPGRDARRYADHCSRQFEVQEAGLAAGPDVAVYWSGAWDSYPHTDPGGVRHEPGTDEYGEIVRNWLQERVDRNRAAEVPTLIAAVPCFGPERGEHRSEETIRWFNDQLMEVVIRNPGWARMILPETVLCDEDGESIGRVDGIVPRPDGLHFTIESGDWFWRTWFAGMIASAFP